MSDERPQCQHVRDDGTRCAARFGLDSDGHCWHHSRIPENIEARAKARSRGGITTAKRYAQARNQSYATEDEVPPPPTSAADAARWASWTVHSVSIGRISPAVGREVSGALRIFLAAVKDSTTAEDIASLQETFAELRDELTGPGPKVVS